VTFDVELDGRRRRVELTREPAGWRAVVDGRSFRVSAAAIANRSSLLMAPLESAGADASYDIAIEDRGRGELVVHADGTLIAITVLDRRGSWSRRGHDQGMAGAGPRVIVAPMSGRVVKLLVQPGDVVAARQGLIVVEAMKMENELRAPREGRVTEVRASEGMPVEANAILIVME